ncbi:MAG: competence/damage-inducible protein A [Oscillospiraceae bacterium]|nr:competence/damage-inducible protein A [Oscillospiraceae bacterium]
MKAEILCVGTEILLGDIVNTNAAYLARELAAIGVPVYHQSVVGDNPGRLEAQLRDSFGRSDLVILTGGLGPTYDDLTKETAARYFGRDMVMDESSLRSIEAFFKKTGREMTDNNRKQALIPEGAVVFQNHCGTAPGLALEAGGRTAILLPGPPREMQMMYETGVRPYLERLSGQVFLSRTIHIFGMGESAVEQKLRPVISKMENPTAAPYAKTGEVQLRVTARASTSAEAARLADPAVQQLSEALGGVVYGVDVGSLQKAAVQALRERGLTAATAESCTGGLVSKRITEVPGASEVFGCGVCSYANGIKEKLLGVPHAVLEARGAVSEETAAAMAEGAARLAGADIGVSTTGIAGPGGGTAQKPVGLVYVGVWSRWHREVLRLELARGQAEEREQIRYLASSHALHALWRTALMYQKERVDETVF